MGYASLRTNTYIYTYIYTYISQGTYQKTGLVVQNILFRASASGPGFYMQTLQATPQTLIRFGLQGRGSTAQVASPTQPGRR